MSRRLRRRSSIACAALLALGAGTAACGRAETVQDRHMAEMREQISRMQMDHDRFDQRLGALELALADEKSPRGPRDQASSGGRGGTFVGPAVPRVVQLGGDGRVEAADPADPSARPEIKVTGAVGSARETSSRARAATLDPDAKKTYEQGLSQVKAKQYDKGIDTLASFLVKWPGHPYAENAMYWRGEAYFAKGDYARAAEELDGVLSRFQGSGKKAPDALLKLGMCHDRMGDPARAQQDWDRLKQDYPRSDAAKKIPSHAAREDRSKGPKESR
jgi:tol-pal system protein YbgF